MQYIYFFGFKQEYYAKQHTSMSRFLMSRCNILRKAHTATVHYTALEKHLLCNRAWQDILILFVVTQICYFHMPGWQMKRHKFDLTKSGLRNHCLGFIESDCIFNPLY